MARNEHGPDFFVDAYFEENPKALKNTKKSGKCPFSNSSIVGLTSRHRKKDIPKGTVPKELFKER